MSQLTLIAPETVSKQLPAWSLCRNGAAVHRSFKFKDFAEAFSFMTRLAFFSEKNDHHPEWSNVYRTVDIELTTHDAGGITERDISWALEADRLYGHSLGGKAAE